MDFKQIADKVLGMLQRADGNDPSRGHPCPGRIISLILSSRLALIFLASSSSISDSSIYSVTNSVISPLRTDPFSHYRFGLLSV